MKQDWVHILGNHDRQLLRQDPRQHGLSDRHAFGLLQEEDLRWLGTLPASARIDGRLLLFHGTPSSDTTYLLDTVAHGGARLATQAEILHRLDGDTSPILLCGHTHVPRVVELPGNVLVVNPGSVGLPAYDDETPEYHVIETGSPHTRYAILEEKDGSWQAEMIALPYDHRPAAQQAGRNGRPDWEYALRTGTMPRQNEELHGRLQS
jgi:diadenosine tetraphosphatase ApaH/serine/threonine PP2A family protein phosphatase